jgi:thiosulfate dehydrogenase [quinone] large subunit
VNNYSHYRLSASQQTALIALRTAIGWHFLYEGYYKVALPGWSRDGAPLPHWTSAAYFKVAPGPLSRLFERLVEAGWVGWIDNAVKVSLFLIGLSLILGLFSKAGSAGAIALLTLFYLTSIPLSGIQQPVSEGAYLLVNKTLIEGVAACVLLTFRTGEIAGLDLLLKARRQRPLAIAKPIEDPVHATAAAKAPHQETFQPERD